MPEWVTIFLSLGGSALIGLIVTTVFNYSMKKVREIKELKEAKEEEKRLQALLEVKNAMEEEKKAIRKGLQALLRNDLYTLYYMCKNKHCATFTEKINFENMYKQYHLMGHNGVMDNIEAKMMALPDSDDGDDIMSELSGEDLEKYLAIMSIRNRNGTSKDKNTNNEDNNNNNNKHKEE